MVVRLDHRIYIPGGAATRLLSQNLPVQIVEHASPSGGDGGGDTPVPIPNTAVKPSSADGTAWSPCGRVGRRRILYERPRSVRRPGPFVVQAPGRASGYRV